MTINNQQNSQKLVIIIPALNEEKTIADVINAIPSNISNISQTDVIVIDDGSTDKTAQIAETNNAFVVQHPKTIGVGAAFHTGLRHALQHGADIIVNIDADGQFNPKDIPELIKPIQDKKAWFTTCTRFAKPELIPEMPTIKRFGNKWMVYLINIITGKKFTDVSCGFRAYSRETALRLILFGQFTYTQETFIDLAFKDIPIVEVPLKVRGQREHGKSRVANNLWRYGIKSASIIIRTARDYRPTYFFGFPGLVVFLIGVAIGVFLLIHWLKTGQTSPYRSLVQVSSVFLILGFLLGFIAMLADMMHRNRILLDKIVYLTRKKAYEAKNNDHQNPY
jgi:glycosyltransferase involved in cell wall biosynthesis